MDQIYKARPFQIRNADEYEVSEVLRLFVSPFEGLSTPFDYENNIIKGRMGSGKTMYLRANYAYYFYGIIPALSEGLSPIIPIMIKLSDFQHIRDASQIYRAIVIKIIEELTSAYIKLQDAKYLARVHLGMQNLTPDLLRERKLSDSISRLTKLGADEFVERITVELGIKGEIKPKFIDLSGEYKKNQLTEIKKKEDPGIKDIEEAYKFLLSDQDGKILLLIDEAGSLDRSFFKGKDNDSPFEILMNQLRTTQYIRTKVAIYPNSYQDILTETRYGDVISLEENTHDGEGYKEFRCKAYNIINNYINPNKSFEGGAVCRPEDLFELASTNVGDALEQIINASNGNMRRLIQLLDSSMEAAYSEHKGAGKISLEHVLASLKKHSQKTLSQYAEPDLDLLANVTRACKSRSTFVFEFPYMSVALNKFTSKSDEYNVINIVKFGTGRKSTVYSFDYSYCVLSDLPTHYIVGSEKIDKNRSLENGKWITRVAQLNEKLLDHASISTKMEGAVDFVKSEVGFIKGDDEDIYFFSHENIIDEDRTKEVIQGRRVRFIPYSYGESKVAQGIEIL